MSLTTYSFRKLNPFVGVLQVIENENARAVSGDGIIWKIHVLASQPNHTWRSHTEYNQKKEFYFWAKWSSKIGISQITANPIFDMGAMDKIGRNFIKEIGKEIKNIPFKANDKYELWACDQKERPLALLSSASNIDGTSNETPIHWKAELNEESNFSSKTLKSSDLLEKKSLLSMPHKRFLEDQVKIRYKKQIWFVRSEDGSGLFLKKNKEYKKQDFPIFGVTDKWDSPLVKDIFYEYFEWSAPILLLLQLPDKNRSKIEKWASKQPLLLDKFYQLYPKINDIKLIDQIRVQAQLLRSQ